MPPRESRRNYYIQEMAWRYTQRAYSDSDLATELRTTRSNIYKIRRKMEGELNYPLYEESYGRYRLDPHHFVAHVPLNARESLALYLGARRLQQQTKSGQLSIASALSKLAHALRKPMAAELVKAAQNLLDQEEEPRQAQVLDQIVDGWLQRRRVRIKHRKLHGQLRSYSVAPYLLEPAPWGDGIYLIGHSDYHDGVATFKVERIERAVCTTEPYEMPATFDIHALLQHAWGIWHTDKQPEQVVLHFSRQVAPRVLESIWHPSQQIEMQEDGSCLWRATLAEWREMVPWVRGWGADCQVLEPEPLKNRLAAEARRLARLYGWEVHRVASNESQESGDEHRFFDDFFAG